MPRTAQRPLACTDRAAGIRAGHDRGRGPCGPWTPCGALGAHAQHLPAGKSRAEGRARATRCPGPNGAAESRPGVQAAGVQ